MYKRSEKKCNFFINNDMARRQGTQWMGTVGTATGWQPCLQHGCVYLKGQKELGEGGFEHFQIFFITSSKESVRSVASKWHPVVGHWELTRSAAAESYVWKEATRIGEQFEFGQRPLRRNSSTDWEEIKRLAVSNQIDQIPPDIFIRYYRTLQIIGADYCQPTFIERVCKVFYGPTGTGKSRRAWEEAGVDSFCKDPRSKFWCGYRNQRNVIVDEFRGGIDIAHILRWTDRYPVIVEIKGSSRPLLAERIWFTSNLHPNEWYPELDEATKNALIRRLEIIEIL